MANSRGQGRKWLRPTPEARFRFGMYKGLSRGAPWTLHVETRVRTGLGGGGRWKYILGEIRRKSLAK
eukprot:9196097-Pyramimonas_sp.AAC.1